MRLYRKAECAAELRLSPASIDRLIRRGALHVIHPTGGRSVRITERELERFVAARESEADDARIPA